MEINDNAVKANKFVTKVQYGLAVITLLSALVVSLTSNPEIMYNRLHIAMVWLFCIFGLPAFLICGGIRQEYSNRFKKYREIIEGKDFVIFSEITDIKNRDEKHIREDIEWMWQHNFFCNVEIDTLYMKKRGVNIPVSKLRKKEKVLEGLSKKRKSTENGFDTKKEDTLTRSYNNMLEIEREQEDKKEKLEGIYISAVCDCCGGITMIEVGQGGICDYCRAPLGKYKNI